MNFREMIEQREEKFLSPYALRSKNTKGRIKTIDKCNVRTEFQRDRDRIIHSKSFRRLKHKTQVFLTPKDDHYQTRLTHTLQVSQIARTISRALNLNEDLTEAIALGHDLGHTPFGHAGENALNKISPRGFRHNENSLRVVDVLEGGCGLNLTYEVRDGILNHNGNNQPSTLEGVVIKFADKIAYINHDIDDAKRGGILTEDDIPKEFTNILGNTHSKRIDTMILGILSRSFGKDKVEMESEIFEAMMKLREFMFKNVYETRELKSEEEKVHYTINNLYNRLLNDIELIPENSRKISDTDDKHLMVTDYISGMTDNFIITKYNELFLPSPWSI